LDGWLVTVRTLACLVGWLVLFQTAMFFEDFELVDPLVFEHGRLRLRRALRIAR